MTRTILDTHFDPTGYSACSFFSSIFWCQFCRIWQFRLKVANFVSIEHVGIFLYHLVLLTTNINLVQIPVISFTLMVVVFFPLYFMINSSSQSLVYYLVLLRSLVQVAGQIIPYNTIAKCFISFHNIKNVSLGLSQL